MTEVDIAYQRLHNQKVSRSTFTKPEDVVRWMGAVQAQDYLYSLWAIGLRMQSAIAADVEQAIADRTILRTWPMRGTVHLVPAEDAAWMLNLLSQQVVIKSRSVRRKAGLDETTFRKSKKILAKLLQGKALTRNEVYDTLERAGIAAHLKTPVGSRGMHIIAHLAREGLICFGPRRGKQPTFVLLEEWVANPRRLERDEALGELAGRYFRSRGPATEYDFAWWSGLPVSDARASVDMVSPPLVQEKFAGKTSWFAGSVSAPVRSSGKAYLLPYVDEYTVAYKDRSALADPKLTKQINAVSPVGILGPVIVLNGRIVGLWKRTIEKRKVVISTNLFTPNVQKAVAAAAESYGTFVGLPVAFAA
jgi:Winged helix DNA-binding domain